MGAGESAIEPRDWTVEQLVRTSEMVESKLEMPNPRLVHHTNFRWLYYTQRDYSGTEEDKPCLIFVKKVVFDVSIDKELYGPGGRLVG
jgi:hypothetical protein